jgi:hypothetical protein
MAPSRTRRHSRHDRCPSRRMIGLMIENHPNCTGPHLG